jgi:hypothetical protein
MVLKWFSDFWNSFKKQPELPVFELPTTTTMLWYKFFEGTKILHWCGGCNYYYKHEIDPHGYQDGSKVCSHGLQKRN